MTRSTVTNGILIATAALAMIWVLHNPDPVANVPDRANATPSLRARLLAFAVSLMRVRHMWDPDRLEQTIAKDRERGPALPSDEFESRFIVQTRQYLGSTIYVVEPKGVAIQREVLYLHGGGFVLAIQDPHWTLIGKLAERLEARVTVPFYPLAPEHEFAEVWALLLPLYESLLTSGGAQAPVVIGDSAGATLCLSLAQQVRDAGMQQPSRIVMISPVLDFSFTDPALVRLDKRDPIVGLPGMAKLARLHAGALDLRDPLISPIFGSLSGLAPMALFTGTRDITHADALQFKIKAAKERVAFRYFEYREMLHVWPMFPIPEADEAIDEMRKFVTEPPPGTSGT